jgi:hypothetical protein
MSLTPPSQSRPPCPLLRRGSSWGLRGCESATATFAHAAKPPMSPRRSSSCILLVTTRSALRPYQARQARAYITAASSLLTCMRFAFSKLVNPDSPPVGNGHRRDRVYAGPRGARQTAKRPRRNFPVNHSVESHGLLDSQSRELRPSCVHWPAADTPHGHRRSARRLVARGCATPPRSAVTWSDAQSRPPC